MVAKFPANAFPFPMAKFTNPFALVVAEKVSEYTSKPFAEPCLMVILIPTD